MSQKKTKLFQQGSKIQKIQVKNTESKISSNAKKRKKNKDIHKNVKTHKKNKSKINSIKIVD